MRIPRVGHPTLHSFDQIHTISDPHNGILQNHMSATTPTDLREAKHTPKMYVAPTRTRMSGTPYPCGSMIKNGTTKAYPIFSAILPIAIGKQSFRKPYVSTEKTKGNGVSSLVCSPTPVEAKPGKMGKTPLVCAVRQYKTNGVPQKGNHTPLPKIHSTNSFSGRTTFSPSRMSPLPRAKNVSLWYSRISWPGARSTWMRFWYSSVPPRTSLA